MKKKKTILSTILGAIAIGGAYFLANTPNTDPAAIHSGTRAETGKPAILNRTASAPAENARTAAESLAPTEQRSIREQIEAYEHRFTEELAAVNAANGFGVHYDTAAAELAVAPFGEDEGAWAWRIGLANGKAGHTSTDGDRLTIEHGDGVTEWFVNEPTGVEQGFTLTKPPSDGKLTLACTTDLVPVLEGAPGEDSQAVRFDDPHTGETVLRYTELFVYDAHGKRVPAHMELEQSSSSFSSNELALALNDTGAVYPLTVDPTITTLTNVIPQPDDIPSGSSSVNNDFIFGFSLAISGETLVVGLDNTSPSGSNRSGAVYVFTRRAQEWQFAQKLISQEDANGEQAFARGQFTVDLEQDRIVVGALGDDEIEDGSGAIHVFEPDQSGVWAQTAKLKNAIPVRNSGLGQQVHLSGNRIAALAKPSAGSSDIYIFELVDGEWIEEGVISLARVSRFDISGNTIAIGELTGLNSVHVFEPDPSAAGGWSATKVVLPPTGFETDFAEQIAISGDTIVVGTLSPHALVYERSHGGLDNWGLSARIRISESEIRNLAIDGDVIAVSARSQSQPFVHIAERHAGQANSWSVTSIQRLPNPPLTLAISGDTVAAMSATGTSSSVEEIRVFERRSGRWLAPPVTTLDATDPGERLGETFAFNRDLLVVGSPQKHNVLRGGADVGTASAMTSRRAVGALSEHCCRSRPSRATASATAWRSWEKTR